MPILLVEDDAVDAEAVRRALRKEKVDNPLHSARDGVEALEMLRGSKGRSALPQPCVVLLDLNLPRMSGLELLQEMERQAELERNVVFVLTTSARAEDKARAYDLNVAGYVLKDNVVAFVHVLGGYCRVNEFPPRRRTGRTPLGARPEVEGIASS